MTMLRWAASAAVVLLVAGAAQAVTPADKCESDKNKEAGKYAYCRQKAEAKFALTADAGARTAALQKCLAKYDAKWPSIESKAGGACPSTGDQSAIQGAADTYTTNVATALAGGTLPDCDGDLLACQGDLGTCNGSLGTCNANLGTCNADLGTCATDLFNTTVSLNGCTSNLGTCTTTLTATQGNLTTCTGDLATCTGDLGTCNTNLGTTQASLTTCTNNLTSTQASLTTCTGNLGTCNGTLTTCQNDLTTCQAAPQGQRLKTGQTTCWDTAGAVIPCAGTGQDGALQKGLARAYVDNGNGTITDTKTGLMWEKQSDDGTLNDKDNTYTWANAFAVKIAGLNAGGGFAGHTDWRLPNRAELESLVDLGVVNPTVSPAFNTSCTGGCTLATCSCTRSAYYWSSSTYANVPAVAWGVNLDVGSVSANGKTNTYAVRGVRGGS